MTDAAIIEDEVEPKSSKMPLILGIVLLLVGGGGGFYATWSGLLLGGESKKPAAEETKAEDKSPVIEFVAIEPITVSLPQSSAQDHLRFRAELEVAAGYASDVEAMLPRIIDVLNSYLRAVEMNDLTSPAALTRLRAQMLRRVQVVTGPEQVKDLLIMEFVLN
ncbi:flagellar basal body protein FliL [Roseobacter cerasinus]|uniref:Flagellar protein FliL n=1 Tax=Roseobacter cerasinus TaxID=2602289 RepID=A0A640VRQ4_9RHOB|nr:flagellar basal body-associated FliL family protein [Roseobacter cerasinus]GFE49575.1 flagellar basal body protein FliL [Roseobacter cerasinus]